MLNNDVTHLADCREFRQTLEARAPAVVHGTAALLVLLLAGAFAWAAVTEADLVVRAPGRVRPVMPPVRVFAPSGTSLDGRVARVHFEEGDTVSAGQVLLELDSRALDNRIEKLQRTIEASGEELRELDRLSGLIAREYESSQAKAEAELAQAEAELKREQERLASQQRQAEAELEAAEDHLKRIRELLGQGAATREELVEAETAVRQAREKRKQAALPADEGRVEVFRRALQLVEREFAVRQAELQARRAVKRGEREAARKELANLRLEREQAVLHSPVDGVVVSGRIEAGDILPSGKPVLQIAERGELRFEALVPSQEMAQLKTGMPVKIKFDAYDYQQYGTLQGTVCFISPDSQVPEKRQSPPAALGGITSGGPAYVVRVQLEGNHVRRAGRRGRVKLGLGGVAEIVTDRQSVLEILLRKINRTISLG